MDEVQEKKLKKILHGQTALDDILVSLAGMEVEKMNSKDLANFVRVLGEYAGLVDNTGKVK